MSFTANLSKLDENSESTVFPISTKKYSQSTSKAFWNWAQVQNSDLAVQNLSFWQKHEINKRQQVQILCFLYSKLYNKTAENNTKNSEKENYIESVFKK